MCEIRRQSVPYCKVGDYTLEKPGCMDDVRQMVCESAKSGYGTLP